MAYTSDIMSGDSAIGESYIAKCPICGRENKPETLEFSFSPKYTFAVAAYSCNARLSNNLYCNAEYRIKLRGEIAIKFLKETRSSIGRIEAADATKTSWRRR